MSCPCGYDKECSIHCGSGHETGACRVSCIWPNCLSEEEADLLAQECHASLLGEGILVVLPYDKRKECNCDG